MKQTVRLLSVLMICFSGCSLFVQPEIVYTSRQVVRVHAGDNMTVPFDGRLIDEGTYRDVIKKLTDCKNR